MSAENHAIRRRGIAEVVLDVVARDGIEAATIRRIAAAVGYSTTVVTHYFSDKDDLIRSAIQLMGEMNDAKFRAARSTTPPDLLGFLVSMTALGPENLSTWRAWVGFWDRSLRHPELAAELRTWVDQALERIAVLVTAAYPDCIDPQAIAARLFALVQGISTTMLFTPERWPEDEVRRAIAAQVESSVAPVTGRR